MGAFAKLAGWLRAQAYTTPEGRKHTMGLLRDAEAELAARGEERVVEVEERPGDGMCAIMYEDMGTGIELDLVAIRYIFGVEPLHRRGPYGRYAIRPLPDEPKPVAVRPWLIRPNAAQPYLVCRYCQWRAEVGSVACGECGKRFLEPEELPEPVVGEGR